MTMLPSGISGVNPGGVAIGGSSPAAVSTQTSSSTGSFGGLSPFGTQPYQPIEPTGTPYNVGTGVPTMGSLYGSVMSELQGYGQQEQADLHQNYMNAMGMGMQSLASSGLLGLPYPIQPLSTLHSPPIATDWQYLQG